MWRDTSSGSGTCALGPRAGSAANKQYELCLTRYFTSPIFSFHNPKIRELTFKKMAQIVWQWGELLSRPTWWGVGVDAAKYAMPLGMLND